ncbi:type IV pilus assembly protein PilY1 [Pseudoxanthomonas sp. GM95]|uniref:pilus assembly protein n=1 Tax=Pseudoxanthomonas sp. GM95 TaxID=1881043 RepID=UPI0008BA361E|nr:PilC/PilY family type IV pilus protein [Pseudoxanthomonas sp. GM95]SEK68911.1 type IV pilus assembly protein PilY1 [Pseudoxanthomonas sp. GM95]
MSLSRGLKISAVLSILIWAVVSSLNIKSAPADYAIAQTPLYLGQSQPPLMMLVMSRDEQLFNKAYADYTDLNGDQVLDTTYQDAFSYSGYFDPNRCYTYSNGTFSMPGNNNAIATGDNKHYCNGSRWSGNFLNWITMSRLDVLRFVLYGGKRYAEANGSTTLERATIPSDLHAWVKTYSGSDIGNLAGTSGSSLSFCNATTTVGGAPLMRVATGTYTEWASTGTTQCATGSGDRPSASNTNDYIVRVNVCTSTGADNRESFCRSYSDGTNTYYRPAGLLQQYGESGQLRFGLMSGTYSSPRSGGVLRRNIGRIAGNSTGTACTTGDEINLNNGTLCNQGSGTEGIINTIDRFQINGWTGSVWSDCNTYSILNRQSNQHLNNPGSPTNGQLCSAWGNPLAEMYAEAVRYISGGSATFNNTGELLGMPSPAWQDPYRVKASGGNSYCAKCSILVLSSGSVSFDSDEVGTTAAGNPTTLTNTVGGLEGITGANYFAGRTTATPAGDYTLNTHEDTCKSFSVSQLGLVRGICPDAPSVEGSYLMAGIAYGAHTSDVRAASVPTGRPSGRTNTVTTYGVAFEGLPSFRIPVGAASMTLSPLCQANNSGSAQPSGTGWRTCSLGAVGVGTKTSQVSPYNIYGRDLRYNGTNLVAASFSLVWEDSLWGNDHDNDLVGMVTYCVGAACSDQTGGHNICWNANLGNSTPVAACSATGTPQVGSGEVLVRIETLSAYAGNAMLGGFTITGSTTDDTYRAALRPGGTDGSVLTATGNPTTGNPGSWTRPLVYKFTPGAGDTGLLQSPLWYAAKYGGFVDANGGTANVPDDGEWNSRDSTTPDNYFLARNPADLQTQLGQIFQGALGTATPTAGATSGARITGSSLSVETTFSVPDNSNDWIGAVRGSAVQTATGATGAQQWDATTAMPLEAARSIYFNKTPTAYATGGAVTTAAAAAQFSWANLCTTGSTCNFSERIQNLGAPSTASWGGIIFGAQGLPTWVSKLATFLNLDADGSSLGNALVAYLRGNAANEIRNSGTLRSRTSILGDIVNSSPEIVTFRDDYGYGGWSNLTSTAQQALAASYSTYLDTKKGSAYYATPTVFVGANDGMLHAFNGSTGAERFAFIPSTSRSHMYDLADPNYSHEYYVDGLLTVGDIATTATGTWRTVLVGSTGAGSSNGQSSGGAKSVFGLDVTQPGGFSATSVLWEMVGGTGTGQNADLGNVMGKPLIVPVNVTATIGGVAVNGPRWVAIFGNGPNSSSGFPALFVVDAASGQRLAVLKPTPASYAIQNGLMNATGIATVNANGLVDTVYGGDLQGNVWKFDLSNANPSSWQISFGGAPLFTAVIPASGSNPAIPQPITGGIEVASGPSGGVSVYFGTGRYFVEGDNAQANTASRAVQSLYGVWDKLDGTRIGTATGTAAATNGRASLVAQVLSTGTTSTGVTTRNVSNGAVNYASARGWYVDLSLPTVSGSGATAINYYGERFFGTPRIQNGKVFFTTFAPGGVDCGSGGGFNWLYGLDLLTGGGDMSGLTLTPGGTSVCTANCGAIALNASDQSSTPVRTTSILVPQSGGATVCKSGDPGCVFGTSLDAGLAAQQCTLVLKAVGAAPLYLPRPCGRQSWRQIR